MSGPDQPSVRDLLMAYCQGIFPMANPDNGRVEWYDPDPRGVIPLDGAIFSRNLRRLARRRPFEIASDRDFEAVMRACATPRADDPETWISEGLVASYTALHRAGFAHSVEARLDGVLVGGLYGVHIAGAFFGESMFVRPDLGGSNASKLCFLHLIAWLRHQGFVLLDAQMATEHTARLGCVEISADEYQDRLEEALTVEATWGTFRPLLPEDVGF